MVTVIKATNEEDLRNVHVIRRSVFVEEQHCPAELEYANEDVSTHFLAIYDGTPCGAARWRQTENGYKLERFAVLKQFRERGVGAALVRAVLDDLPEDEQPVYLNAQLTAEKFYSAFGFIPHGDHFEEAGIMHQQMILGSWRMRVLQEVKEP